MREAWTDERLDDLKAGMHHEFDRVHTEIRELRAYTEARFDRLDDRFDRVDARFDRVDDRFDRVDDRFDRLEGRFDSLQRTLILGLVSIVAAILAKGLF